MTSEFADLEKLLRPFGERFQDMKSKQKEINSFVSLSNMNQLVYPDQPTDR